jgi:hypothetical protein
VPRFLRASEVDYAGLIRARAKGINLIGESIEIRGDHFKHIAVEIIKQLLFLGLD